MSKIKRLAEEMTHGKCFNCGFNKPLTNGKPHWNKDVCLYCLNCAEEQAHENRYSK